jgi:hypothetical protein
MATRAELVTDGAEWFQEALRVLGGVEALQDSLVLTHGQVGVLRSVGQPLMASVLGRRQHASDSRYISS